MRASAALALAGLCLMAAACYREPVARATPTPTITIVDLSSLPPPPTSAVTPAPTGTPIDLTPTPTPSAAATLGPTPTFFASTPAPDCVEGWIAPVPGSDEYDAGLEIMGSQMGVEGPWQVEELRYFTGPELPNVEPQYPFVERWYVRAALADDPAFRARWLIERRTELIAGISAVAPYDSTGYKSPDWTGFVGEGEPVTYLGLPGQWSGIPYDFVTGAGDSGNPGLPDEVVGCLTGT